MPNINSGVLSRADYDEATQTLSLTFTRSGRTYHYQDVPFSVYDALMRADTPGAYFNEFIKDEYGFN